MLTPLNRETRRGRVMDQVHNAIIQGHLKPGDHVTEEYLTAKLGVSRTPIREALILLQNEGLVVHYPNRGFFVKAFSPQDIDEIFTMRTALENLTAELIIDRLRDSAFQALNALIMDQESCLRRGETDKARLADMQFHQYLVDYSNHSILIRQWGTIVAQVAAILNIRGEAFEAFDEFLAIHEHRDILAAYKRRDIDAVRSINRVINERESARCQEAAARQQG